MRIFYKGFDGGKGSPVTGYWLVEIKGLFSIVLLKFHKGSREKFHSHAFNAFTWFLKGSLTEVRKHPDGQLVTTEYKKSVVPKYTPRDNLHRVFAQEDSWCFSIRGPWVNTWKEWDEETDTYVTLTHGRKEV